MSKDKNKISPALIEKAEKLRGKNVGRIVKRELKRHVVRVTPIHAAQILEKNDMNRTVRQDLVDRFARDMKNGRWALNGETIKFAKDGTLIDGQHRLYAVLLSETPVDLEFVENLDKSIMETIDTGRSRSMQDVFRIGGESYAAEMAGALRWWYNYNRGGISFNRSVSHRELIELLDTIPQMRDFAREACTFTRAKKLLTPSIWTFVFSGMMLADPIRARDFAVQLDTGFDLRSGAPAHTLRERLSSHRATRMRVTQPVLTAFAIKAWNAYYHGKSLKVLKWIMGEEFPQFAGLRATTTRR